MKNFIVLAFCFILLSCNRKTNTDNAVVVEKKEIINEITDDDPFKDQPNELCTIIRKLNVTHYDPAKEVDYNNLSSYPEKYCLLDICLEETSNSAGTLNIGDESQPVTVSYQLIKIFNSVEKAQEYASKHQIKDVIYKE